MDTLVFLNSLAVFLPFLVFLILLFARINLISIKKKNIDRALVFSSLGSFLVFLFDFETKNFCEILNFPFLNFENFALEIGFNITNENIHFLILASFFFFVFSVFFKYYFNLKKQFVFTKQRFSSYFLLLASGAFLYLASENLFTLFLFWAIEGLLVFLFCLFDISKNFTKSNIVRFYKISLLGDFSLLALILLLLKYEILSQDYISSTSLNFLDFDVLISYIFGISSALEFKMMFLLLLVAIISRFIIFPFNCYYSFLSNSQNAICYPIYFINSLFGCFLIQKASSFAILSVAFEKVFLIYCLISAFLVLVSLLFEKNIKIIFGGFFAILNSGFLYLFLFKNEYSNYLILSYFLALGFLLLFLGIFILKDKNNFSSRLINKQTGFWVEKGSIFLFEKVPYGVCFLLDFLKKNLIEKIYALPFRVFEFLSGFLAYKFKKINKKSTTKQMLIFFVLLVLFVLLVSLFESSRG